MVNLCGRFQKVLWLLLDSDSVGSFSFLVYVLLAFNLCMAWLILVLLLLALGVFPRDMRGKAFMVRLCRFLVQLKES